MSSIYDWTLWKWAIYFVGPIAPTSLNKRHIFVCTHFVTKWVEAKVVSFATGKVVVDFLFNVIFTRFGVPRAIVTNNGPQLISNMVKGIMEQYKIWHKKSTPYHPHENDHVESTNKVVESILIKTINLHKKDWANKFPESLWAYITNWRNITCHTPYELLHGKQVLLAIEFQIKKIITPVQLVLDLLEAQQHRLLQLNELDEFRRDVVQKNVFV